eukprot:15106098-Alexandrium_andersonii.AAC.1
MLLRFIRSGPLHVTVRWRHQVECGRACGVFLVGRAQVQLVVGGLLLSIGLLFGCAVGFANILTRAIET